MQRDRGNLIAGFGLGAAAMYLLDPGGGGRRRALLRDQMTHAAHVTRDAVGTTRRDMSNRAAGAGARLRRTFRSEAVDDGVLTERVRARLGRVVKHSHALDIDSANGIVRLRGPILGSEAARAVKAAKRVKGVRRVVNALEQHADPAGVPSLQEGGRASEPTWSARLRAWSPARRVLVGTTAATGLALLTRATGRGAA